MMTAENHLNDAHAALKVAWDRAQRQDERELAVRIAEAHIAAAKVALDVAFYVLSAAT